MLERASLTDAQRRGCVSGQLVEQLGVPEESAQLRLFALREPDRVRRHEHAASGGLEERPLGDAPGVEARSERVSQDRSASVLRARASAMPPRMASCAACIAERSTSSDETFASRELGAAAGLASRALPRGKCSWTAASRADSSTGLTSARRSISGAPRVSSSIR